jgi:hypothetical protein
MAMPSDAHLSFQLHREAQIRGIMVQASMGINQESKSKITNVESAGGEAQVVEHLPSK